MSSTENLPRVPSAYVTSALVAIIVFQILATVAVGVRIYCSRISHRDDWMTRDLWLIIGALIVSYGYIIADIIGSAVVGLNFIGTRLSLVKAAEFTFKVSQEATMLITISLQTKLGLLRRCFPHHCQQRIMQNLNTRVLQADLHNKRLHHHVQLYDVPGSCVDDWHVLREWSFCSFIPPCYGSQYGQTQLFSTTPISSGWHPALQLQDANYNYPIAFLAIFGIGIVLDVLVLCLPLRPIYKLQLTWSKKIRISAILWLGIFCVVCASVRFYYTHLQLYVVFNATATEKAHITVNASLWSKLEPSASIIAACLPTYGPLVQKRNIGSVAKRAAKIFSIGSGSRTTTSGHSRHYSPGDYDGVNHGWHELRPQNPSHETTIEASSIQSLQKPEAKYIRTTSEFTVTDGERL